MLDQVSFAVNYLIIFPVLLAYLAEMHQSFDIVHIAVVLHCRLVNLPEMLLVVVVMSQFLVLANLALVDIR